MWCTFRLNPFLLMLHVCAGVKSARKYACSVRLHIYATGTLCACLRVLNFASHAPLSRIARAPHAHLPRTTRLRVLRYKRIYAYLCVYAAIARKIRYFTQWSLHGMGHGVQWAQTLDRGLEWWLEAMPSNVMVLPGASTAVVDIQNSDKLCFRYPL